MPVTLRYAEPARITLTEKQLLHNSWTKPRGPVTTRYDAQLARAQRTFAQTFPQLRGLAPDLSISEALGLVEANRHAAEMEAGSAAMIAEDLPAEQRAYAALNAQRPNFFQFLWQVDRPDAHNFPAFLLQLASLGDCPECRAERALEELDAGAGQTAAASGAAAQDLGALRETRVAEMTGGRVARTPVMTKFGSTEIDVVGSRGQYIEVGGPAKAADLSGLGQQLQRLRAAAEDAGTFAQVYFEEGTPEDAYRVARRWVGNENVFTYSRGG